MFIDRHKKGMRCLCGILFLLYLTALVYFLFFAEMLGRTNVNRVYSYNLILFREIGRFWVHRRQLGALAVFLNIGGNVLIFAPFGFLLPAMRRSLRRAGRVTLLGFFFSLTVETVQLLTRTGSFDVDDLLLNTLGALLGYACYAMIQKKRDRNAERRRMEG